MACLPSSPAFMMLTFLLLQSTPLCMTMTMGYPMSLPADFLPQPAKMPSSSFKLVKKKFDVILNFSLSLPFYIQSDIILLTVPSKYCQRSTSRHCSLLSSLERERTFLGYRMYALSVPFTCSSSLGHPNFLPCFIHRS